MIVRDLIPFSLAPVRVRLTPIEEWMGMPDAFSWLEPYGEEGNKLSSPHDQTPKGWLVETDRSLFKGIQSAYICGVSKGDTVELHPLSFTHKDLLIDGIQEFALDDQIINDVKRYGYVSSESSDEDIQNWFREEFFFEPLSSIDYGSIFTSSFHNTGDDQEQMGGRQLLGRKYSANLGRLSDGSIGVLKVVLRRKKNVAFRRYRVKTDFVLRRLVDNVKSDPIFQQQFESARLDPKGFLNLWEKYATADQKRLEKLKESAGVLFYESKEIIEGSSEITFTLKKGSEEHAQQFLEKLKEMQKEEQEVSIFSEEAFASYQKGVKPILSSYKVIECNPPYTTFTVSRKKDQKNPPPKGRIELSLMGWEVKNQRWRQALNCVQSGSMGIPQLYYHFYSLKIPENGRTHSSRRLRDAQLLDAFDGKMPNRKQLEAIRICLDTPDIALIQGPPGTGKTQVIAALQKILGTPVDKSTRPETVLLTSYQHDAVDNVAKKVRIFGLPAYRFGAKDESHSLSPFFKWQKEMSDHLEKSSALCEKNPEYIQYRHLRDLLISTHTYSEASRFLYDHLCEIITYGGSLLNPGMFTALKELALLIKPRIDTPKTVWKALISVRTTPSGFNDDGPQQLLKCLNVLRMWATMEENVPNAVQAAIDQLQNWANSNMQAVEEINERLEQIRQIVETILNYIIPDPLRLIDKDVFTNIQNTVVELLNAVQEKMRSIKAGRADILLDFSEKIRSESLEAREVIAHYTMVYATTCQKTASSRFMDIRNRHINETDNGFDYVIIDEAARANPLDLFIPMIKAQKKVILVGDHRQLPHIVEQPIIDLMDEPEQGSVDSPGAPDLEGLLKDSLFERLWNHLKTLGRTVTLDTQYRMHPVLGDFISRVFYEKDGNRIASPRKPDEFSHSVKRYKELCAAWEEPRNPEYEKKSGTGWINVAEADLVVERVKEILEDSVETIGVITPYRAQAQLINDQLKSKQVLDIERHSVGSEHRLRIGTVDAFQGMEFDVVLFSAVRNNDRPCSNEKEALSKFGFLTFENRMNVSLSRQRKLLIVIGSRTMFSDDSARVYVNGLYEFMNLCRTVRNG